MFALLCLEMLDRKKEMYFRSRKKGARKNPMKEWEFAVCMAKESILYTHGCKRYNSPQLDYIKDLTEHDDEIYVCELQVLLR